MKKNVTRLLALSLLVTSLSSPALAVSFSEPVAATAATTNPGPNSVKSAVKDFKSLPRSERRTRVKEAKKLLKEYKANKRPGNKEETDIVLLAILAILLPPLAVYLHQGEVNGKFWLSLILTLLFWIPGVVYALLVIFDAV